MKVKNVTEVRRQACICTGAIAEQHCFLGIGMAFISPEAGSHGTKSPVPHASYASPFTRYVQQVMLGSHSLHCILVSTHPVSLEGFFEC